MSGALATAAIAEVHALHAFFVAWFRPAGAELDFGEVERSLAPDFRMVTPDGVARDRDAVLGAIREARGARGSDFEITIRDMQPAWTAAGMVLLEFTEEQYRERKITRRRSTALFTHDATAPRGVVWRHLHETWIADQERRRNKTRGLGGHT